MSIPSQVSKSLHQQTATQVKAALDFTNRLINECVKFLYQGEFEYWNTRLNQLQVKNCSLWGQPTYHCILYDGHVYSRSMLFESTVTPVEKHYLQLHPDHPELEAEMQTISRELTYLSQQRYEIERYLKGVFSFQPPVDVLIDLLGEPMVTKISYYLRSPDYRSGQFWNDNMKEAFQTFVQQNKDSKARINERVLHNFMMEQDK